MNFIETQRKNYSAFEKEAFRRCLTGFEAIIENKSSLNVINVAKTKAWNEITALYNNIPGVGKRTAKQLQDLYKNLKKRRKIQANRRVQIFVKTDESPKEPSIAIDKRLEAMGAMIKIFDSVQANPDLNASEAAHCENSLDHLEPHEIIEVKSADESGCLKDFDASQLSCFNVPGSLIPKTSSTESCSRESQADPSPAKTPNETKTPDTFARQLKGGKKQLQESGKDDSSTCDINKQILVERHEWDWERFNMEKEKNAMEKEKHLLEMKLMKEQIKMYELINEKIQKDEGIKICVNINR